MNDNTKVATTTGSAIGISAFASFIGLCCIGPWAVVLFGVSGAVTMARWQPYRPYILAVALAMLGWAFWRVYRPQPACADGSCPTGPAPQDCPDGKAALARRACAVRYRPPQRIA